MEIDFDVPTGWPSARLDSRYKEPTLECCSLANCFPTMSAIKRTLADTSPSPEPDSKKLPKVTPGAMDDDDGIYGDAHSTIDGDEPGDMPPPSSGTTPTIQDVFDGIAGYVADHILHAVGC